MSNKRAAANELNADNWDEEVESEEKGTFRTAPEEELQKRVLRTAKRRSNLPATTEDAKKGVFGNFSGFGKTASTGSPFSFLNNLTNGKTDSNKPPEVKLPTPQQEIIATTTEQMKASAKSVNNVNHSDEYCANLKNLNQGILDWIKSHIEKNPYCILTPIFDDYKKYLNEFEKFKTETKSVDSFKIETKPTDIFSVKNKDLPPTPQLSTTKPSIMETPKSREKLDSNKLNSPTNIFSQGFSSTPVSKPTMFSFGQQSLTSTSNTLNFNAGKPFSFNSIVPEKPNEPKPDEEIEEDDEPPKVTFTPVVEEDFVYSKRCKVYVKNDETFGDRGVGTLYLKPINDSEKYQLIVRADTSLGNLLLNMVLSAAIPTKKLGKNNVMLVTIPTPEAKPPPVPLLLRVKTSDEADELLATLDKYKK